MKKTILFFSILLLSSLGMGQTIEQIGFYPINGVMGLASVNNYMILGSGDIVDISDLLSGQYIIKFRTEKGIITEKLSIL